MGTALGALTPSATFSALLKVGDNTALSSSPKRLSDGAGNDTFLWLSTLGITNFGANPSGVDPEVFFNSNTAFGLESLVGKDATSYKNTAFGAGVLASSLTSSANTGIGFYALRATTSGASNTALGSLALRENTTGSDNVAIGASSLSIATTASSNTAIGRNSMLSTTTGFENTAIGKDALHTNATGDSNVSVGALSMYSNTTGTLNVAIGHGTLFSNTSGGANVAIGASAMSSATTALNNVVIGVSAMETQDFSGCIAIGAFADPEANNTFTVGSAAAPAGAIATETLTPDTSWTVRINGANYKIPLEAL
jgi:hypothetical protein